MNYNERIKRMRAAGILTETQAEQLAASLSVTGVDRSHSAHRRIPVHWMVSAFIVLLAILVVLFIGQDTTPQHIQDVSSALNQPGGTGNMNNYLSGAIAAALLLIVPLLLFVWSYNSIVEKEEAVFSAWAQVESNYQRRSELIPNLIETVSTYLEYERGTLKEITEARSGPAGSLEEAVSGLIDTQDETASLLSASDEKLLEDKGRLDKLASAEQELKNRISGIFAIAEDYPDLRSSDQMLALQSELEGTENRINVARMRFNEAAESFNSAIRKLPGSLIASLGNFRRKAYFKADEGAEDAVEVDMD